MGSFADAVDITLLRRGLEISVVASCVAAREMTDAGAGIGLICSSSSGRLREWLGASSSVITATDENQQ